ncbi:MAG TPA: hypothetical protein VGS41_01430, partial [Chthonomonadales bacterium]|nr:hypothetical protein [Chthonomonadales bacterium]
MNSPAIRKPDVAMRIALFSECYRPVANGVVSSILTLREALEHRGHSVLIVAPGSDQPDEPGVYR